MTRLALTCQLALYIKPKALHLRVNNKYDLFSNVLFIYRVAVDPQEVLMMGNG